MAILSNLVLRKRSQWLTKGVHPSINMVNPHHQRTGADIVQSDSSEGGEFLDDAIRIYEQPLSDNDQNDYTSNKAELRNRITFQV